MADRNRAVGILGGTFDPVHNGHISIAKSFLNSPYIDRLWVLLSPASPHKNDQNFTAYNLRFKMLKAAFEFFNNIEISDLEYSLPRPSYTIQTLRYLNKSQPNRSFYLCLGMDSFHGFNRWYKYKEMLTYCELLVARRPNSGNTPMQNELLDSAHFVKHRPVDISSTEIRAKINLGESIEEYVPERVLDIIKSQNIYRD